MECMNTDSIFLEHYIETLYSLVYAYISGYFIFIHLQHFQKFFDYANLITNKIVS